MIINIMIVLLLLFFVSWIVGFFLFNDLSVKTRKSIVFNKILLVYPHPDDEAFTAGGLTKKLSNIGNTIDALIITRGEKGTPDAHKEERLKNIRTKEAKKVAKILGINKIIIKDLPDGGLIKKRSIVEKEIISTIKLVEPELIITFDETGLYGHPDHIVTSEIITNLVINKFNKTKLWYASSPAKVLKIMKLPEHMAKNKNFKRKRKYPNLKVYVGVLGMFAKIKGIYAYQSQFESFPTAFPINWIPLWCYFLVQPYEYFYETK